LQTIHPFITEENTSALTNYPADKSRFLLAEDFLYVIADVTIGGDTKQINLINPCARATSGDAQGKYDMRKFDVEVLKDTLMLNIQQPILLGGLQ
jgi:hypothetical protein